jgi:hypothetical protein
MRRLLLALAMLWPVSATADPSLSFDGTGDYARGTPPFTTMPLTMACFVRVTSLASNSTIMGTYNSGISRRRSMDLGTGGAVSATSGGAEGIVDATSSDGLTAGTWGTAAVIFGSTTSRLAYMDGGNEGTDTATSTSVTAADRLSMGRTDSASSSRPYTGQIAGCAVWSAALSAEEVAAFHKGISACSRMVRPVPGHRGHRSGLVRQQPDHHGRNRQSTGPAPRGASMSEVRSR